MKKTFFLSSLIGILLLLSCGACHQRRSGENGSEPIGHVTVVARTPNTVGYAFQPADEIGIYLYDGQVPAAHNLRFRTEDGGTTALFSAVQGTEAIPYTAQSQQLFAYYPYTQISGGMRTLVQQYKPETGFTNIMVSERVSITNDPLVVLEMKPTMAELVIALEDAAGNRIKTAALTVGAVARKAVLDLETGFYHSLSDRGDIALVTGSKETFRTWLIPDEPMAKPILSIQALGSSFTFRALPSNFLASHRYSYVLRLQADGTVEIVDKASGEIIDWQEGADSEVEVSPEEGEEPEPQPEPDDRDFQGEVIIGSDARLLELPRPTGGGHNYLITHKVSGQVNYTVEFDTQLRSPRFVAFTFHQGNNGTNVPRSNKWIEDPFIPGGKSDTESLYKAQKKYSRGHLVASNDRRHSKAQEQQTFYMTNRTPQEASHNAGIWNTLESLVQNWGRRGLQGSTDTLYVAKGICLEQDRLVTQDIIPLPVSRYFWMACIKKVGDQYYGIALLSDHLDGKGPTPKSKLAMSIDELEAFIGKDLFFNMKKELQQSVESQKPTEYLHIWNGL